MSAFQPVLSKTNKRRIQKATPQEQTRILSTILKSCTFCQGLHNVEDCEALQNTKCKFCGGMGHTANVRFCKALAQKVQRDKEREERIKEREERMKETVCFYCKEAGHVKGKCPILIERNKKREADFPVFLKSKNEKNEKKETKPAQGWSTIVQSNRPASIVIAVDKANEEAKREAERLKAKKHAEYLALCEAREQEARDYRDRYVSNMLDRFGSRWFNFVKVYRDGEFDNDIAKEYRWDDEIEQHEQAHKRDMEEYEMERIEIEEEKKIQEKKRAEREHNKKTMTHEEFKRWKQEEKEKERDDIDLDMECYESLYMSRAGNYERTAPPEYAQYCYKTGLMLDYDAKVLENGRLMNEWKKEKEAQTKA
jgi:hypothetical protein